MSITLRRLVLALALIAGFSFVAARAQEAEGEPTASERAALNPIDELGVRALNALVEKHYDLGLSLYKDAAEQLERATVRPGLKKTRWQLIHYNWACGLSLMGRKDEAARQLARSIADGYWLWSEIEKDPDLDAIRNEDGYKKAIEAGKAAQKAAVEAQEKTLPAAIKKSLEGRALFPLDITMTGLDKKPITLEGLNGKAVVVHYFTTTDDSAYPEIAHLVNLYEKYREKGLEIVGVGLGDREALVEFVKAKGMNWVVAPAVATDPLVKVAVERRCQTLFLDRGGRVRARGGAFTTYEPLDEAVKLLLDAKTPPVEPGKAEPREDERDKGKDEPRRSPR